MTELPAQLSVHADDDYCYLTTRGRATGRAHEIEIWFALRAATLYLLAGAREQSDWVRNLVADPAVTVRVGDIAYAATARVIDSATEEDEVARTLVHGKYAGRGHGELVDWRARALPVALDVSGRRE